MPIPRPVLTPAMIAQPRAAVCRPCADVSTYNIPYTAVTFAAAHKETGKSRKLTLPPMWVSSGLHYSANCALLGDGTHTAMVAVVTPTIQRELKDTDLWATAVTAKAYLRIT